MNLERVTSNLTKVYFAKGLDEKKLDENAPPGLLQSAIDASEKILIDSNSSETKNRVDLKV